MLVCGAEERIAERASSSRGGVVTPRARRGLRAGDPRGDRARECVPLVWRPLDGRPMQASPSRPVGRRTASRATIPTRTARRSARAYIPASRRLAAQSAHVRGAASASRRRRARTRRDRSRRREVVEEEERSAPIASASFTQWWTRSVPTPSSDRQSGDLKLVPTAVVVATSTRAFPGEANRPPNAPMSR